MKFDLFLQRHRRRLPVIWVLLSGIIVALDYRIGPVIQFPILFTIPVLLASWYSGPLWGGLFAVLLPLIRLYFITLTTVPWTTLESTINAAIRIVLLVIISLLTVMVSKEKRRLEEEVTILEGLLPICSYCKKIRDEDGTWDQLERYITHHSEATFSHGICPDCLEKHFPEVAERQRNASK